MSAVRRAALVATSTVALLVGAVTSAHAAPGDGSNDRPSFSAGVVRVTLSGDVDHSQYDSSSATVPATCYWTSTDIAADPANAVEWAAAFRQAAGVDDLSNVLTNPANTDPVRGDSDRIRFLPNGLASLDSAIAADLVEPGVVWYQQALGPYDGAYSDALKADSGCAKRDVFTPWSPLYAYDYFRVRPEPQVDIDVLVDYAFSRLLLPDPRLNWNPKIKNRGNSTLVNLPTWIWVGDEDAVGDLEIIAETPDLSVTLSAEPLSTTVTSVAAGKPCTLAQIRQPYASGVDPSKGCTVTFSRPSRAGGGGFGVQTTVVWSGRYQASDGRQGDLGTRTITYTTAIPVAQSQAVVTEVD